MKSLIPPHFVKVPPQTLYDLTLSASVHRTYEQIIGLCWQREDDRTPPMTIPELCIITGLQERRLWGHLRELRRRALLAWEKVKGSDRLVLRPILPGQEDVVDCTADNLEVMAEFGVDIGHEFPRKIAALPHVTPDLVRTWGQHYRSRQGIHNLPGLLLYTLQSKKPLPQGKDPRGGPRTPAGEEEGEQGESSAAATPAQASLPEPSDVPAPVGQPPAEPSQVLDELRRPLRSLGWEGDLDEVADIVVRDGDEGQRVRAWVQQVTRFKDRYTNPAGFLRTVLRGDGWPEEERSHEPERGQPAWSENIGDRLDVV